MSAIRPLERGDLPQVASLYELVARSGSRNPPPELVPYFEGTVLDHPWFDPEIPSLVYEDPDEGIVGFIGSHVRRLRRNGRPVRMACSGQLVADPNSSKSGVGALLMRRYLAGPQDLTLTDGATDEVRAMWEGLGGRTSSLASMGWSRVFDPVRFGVALLARRAERPSPLLSRPRRRPPRGPTRAPHPDTVAEPLDPGTLVDTLPALEKAFPLRPAYDRPFLEWLFAQLDAVSGRGRLSARLVRDAGGTALGWFVYYVEPGGISQLLQLAAAPRNAGRVLDRLFFEAAGAGSAAVQGRLESHLFPHLATRRCLFRRTEWALLHSDDHDLLGAIALGDALLTRLEGEWWMGHHLIGR